MVEVGWSVGGEGGSVWGTTNWNHLLVGVLEQNLDVGGAFLVNAVLDEVLTVIVISNLAWDLGTSLRVGDLDLEGVTA